MSKIGEIINTVTTAEVNISDLETAAELWRIDSIYIASPYSAGNATPELLQERWEEVSSHMSKIMSIGINAFSPIMHCHPASTCGEGLPKTWDFWKKYDTFYLESHRCFGILKMPGWDISEGICEELKLAINLGKVPFLIDPYN